eukprot:scaffold44262_cov15-Tisochrysis_lutea.AAC.1
MNSLAVGSCAARLEKGWRHAAHKRPQPPHSSPPLLQPWLARKLQQHWHQRRQRGGAAAGRRDGAGRPHKLAAADAQQGVLEFLGAPAHTQAE